MTEKQGPWIQTIIGEAFHLLAPDSDQIHLTTIATVLSRICRFGGHSREFYSVAEHSLAVCNIVSEQTTDDAIRFAALLHDAHEAYNGFGDVCRPAKGMAPQINKVNDSIDAAIAEAMGFDRVLFHRYEIKRADETMLATEARDLMEAPPKPWIELPPPRLETIIPAGASNMTRVAEVFVARGRGFLWTLKLLNKKGIQP